MRNGKGSSYYNIIIINFLHVKNRGFSQKKFKH